MNYSRETYWISRIRKYPFKIKIKEMNNEHLANAIKYLEKEKKRNKSRAISISKMIVSLKEEARFRKLSESFLDNAPYKFKINAPYDKFYLNKRYTFINERSE